MIGITQLRDGTILGIGTDHMLYTGALVTSPAPAEPASGIAPARPMTRNEVRGATRPPLGCAHDGVARVHSGLGRKPPQSGGTNVARWNAIQDLADAAVREADKLGFKMVNSPADFRGVSTDRPCVWLEVIDPMHRDHGDLSREYKAWLNDSDSITKKKSFWGFRNAQLNVPSYELEYKNKPGLDMAVYDTLARYLTATPLAHAAAPKQLASAPGRSAAKMRRTHRSVTAALFARGTVRQGQRQSVGIEARARAS